jgi:hypothetical protein
MHILLRFAPFASLEHQDQDRFYIYIYMTQPRPFTLALLYVFSTKTPASCSGWITRETNRRGKKKGVWTHVLVGPPRLAAAAAETSSVSRKPLSDSRHSPCLAGCSTVAAVNRPLPQLIHHLPPNSLSVIKTPPPLSDTWALVS